MDTLPARSISRFSVLAIDIVLAVLALGMAGLISWQLRVSGTDPHGIVQVVGFVLAGVGVLFGIAAIGVWRRWKHQWLLQILGPLVLAFFLFGPL